MITLKEWAGMLVIMMLSWVLIPWEPDLSRFSICCAFFCVALIGFVGVGTIELIYEIILDLIRKHKK